MQGKKASSGHFAGEAIPSEPHPNSLRGDMPGGFSPAAFPFSRRIRFFVLPAGVMRDTLKEKREVPP
jgi:hypothetical protein